MSKSTTTKSSQKTQQPLPTQVIVVGGGLAGLVTAYAVAKTGLEVIHLAPIAPMDHRTSALMTPSVTIMQNLGLVDDPSDIGVALKYIRIIDATSRLIRAPEALFDSAEAGIEAFGWNFANSHLSQQFAPLIKQLNNLTQLDASATAMRKSSHGWCLELSNGKSLQAPLIIGADGKASFVRQSIGINIKQHQHEQSALVCDLTLEHALEGESVEYHYENGPFTLVPAGGDKANLVWVDEGATLNEIKFLPAHDILNLIQKKSKNLFGNLALDTNVFVFPLSSHFAHKMGQDGVVLVGEAGHAFPPIGAQGLNLSLRDVSDLIDCLKQTSTDQAGWAQLVASAYDQRRASDIKRTSTMVDTLFRSLLSDLLPAQAVRAGGIWALKAIPRLRKFAFQIGMGAS